MDCPEDFKYMSNGFPPSGRCVYKTENDLFVSLNTLPRPRPNEGMAPYTTETKRVDIAIENIRKAARERQEKRAAVDGYDREKRIRGVQFNQLQSEYATITMARRTAEAIRDTNTSLKELRPPTAPGDDIEHERQAIQKIVSRRILLLQIVLAILVLSLVAYLVMPVTYAHGIVFLLLCVGIAVGIFLEK